MRQPRNGRSIQSRRLSGNSIEQCTLMITQNYTNYYFSDFSLFNWVEHHSPRCCTVSSNRISLVACNEESNIPTLNWRAEAIKPLYEITRSCGGWHLFINLLFLTFPEKWRKRKQRKTWKYFETVKCPNLYFH